jgi:hypothetical protein
MTTEKFTETAETFKKNVNDSMKWLQDTTATIIETQNKQMKSASEMYSKAITETLEGINKDNFNSSFGWSETVVDILKKNIETISEMSKVSMKTAVEFGKQAGADTFSKEKTAAIIDSYKKQVEEITAFNKNSFDSITKQFELTKTSFAPWAEKFKKEFEAAIASSKEKIQSIIDSYSKVANPSVQTNKEVFNKLNEQINANFNANLKFWSELTNAYNTKKFDTKNVADFFKTNAWTGSNGTQKKQETAK